MIGDELVCATGAPAPAGAPAGPNAPMGQQPVPIVLTISDLRSMAIDPGEMGVQPPADTVLINIETIVYSGARRQIEDRLLGGTPVRLRADPVNYHWDFGDGYSFDTTKPGAPYPDHYLWHEYTVPTGPDVTRTITLTVTWEGAFSVDGGQWQLIDGSTTTTQASHAFRVVEMRSRLVTPPG